MTALDTSISIVYVRHSPYDAIYVAGGCAFDLPSMCRRDSRRITASVYNFPKIQMASEYCLSECRHHPSS